MISFINRRWRYVYPWIHEFLVQGRSNKNRWSIIRVGSGDINGPIAQIFERDGAIERTPDLGSRLMFDSTGRRGIISIGEEILLIDALAQ